MPGASASGFHNYKTKPANTIMMSTNLFYKRAKNEITTKTGIVEESGEPERMGHISDKDLIETICGKTTDTTMSLQDLSKLGQDALEYGGLTKKQAQKLNAAFELARRLHKPAADEKPRLQQPKEVNEFFAPFMRNLNKEVFYIAYLNSAKRLEGYESLSVGGSNATIVDPPEVLRKAIMNKAHGIIILHNHPSGNTRPSRADINLTKRLVEGGETVGVQVLDHVIIAGYHYTSLKSEGIIP